MNKKGKNEKILKDKEVGKGRYDGIRGYCPGHTQGLRQNFLSQDNISGWTSACRQLRPILSFAEFVFVASVITIYQH